MSKKFLMSIAFIVLGMLIGIVVTMATIGMVDSRVQKITPKPITLSSSQNKSDVYNRYMLRNCLIELETEKGGE